MAWEAADKCDFRDPYPCGLLIGKPPLPKLSSQRTLRWKEMDSNFQFLVARGCVPFGDGSLPTGLRKALEKGSKPPKP
jgi:hypothetical protein